MNENVERFNKYLVSEGVDEECKRRAFDSSVFLAFWIMRHAHFNQKRENGDNYETHPYRVLLNYRNLIGIGDDGDGILDEDLMFKYNIPFDGVQEVCLLHDVIEDTELNLEDVRNIFARYGFEKYFDMYIKDSLSRITHDKGVDYFKYIENCLGNPISSIVKLCDLQDNLRVIDLIKFDEDRLKRAEKYLTFAYILNNTYHFLENVNKYKKELNKEEE